MKGFPYIAFTICSNNYLGQALALKQSFLKHNPNFGFYIILVDQFSDKADYSAFEPSTIITIADIDGVDLKDLISRYYIIALNTCIKPSVFKYLINKHPRVEAIYYLDPDLYFFDSISGLNDKLKTKTAVLTPHILTPIPRDGKLPDENIFMKYGIYNLGFLGLNAKSKETKTMLDWWEERTLKFGYDKVNEGYFVDQLWMIYAPIFYKDIEVLTTYNYNMAPWNLHERRIISIDNGNILLNDQSQLVFYHFSKLAENDTDISRDFNRFNLDDFPLLKMLYNQYKDVLMTCRYNDYKDIPNAYPVSMRLNEDSKKTSMLQKGMKKLGHYILKLARKV
ncbi:hypothetical protein V8G69_04760 [Gaetbulibacter sp. M235]|uniref:hypothetical protein n=1 Tax=Gaetbulibacter sp. M235 TaxID=3126510 RepID=UPI00374F1660